MGTQTDDVNRVCLLATSCLDDPWYDYQGWCTWQCPTGTTPNSISRGCIGDAENNCSSSQYSMGEDCVDECPQGTRTFEGEGVCIVTHPCTEPQFLYQVSCVDQCPDDTIANPYTRICTDPSKSMYSISV